MKYGMRERLSGAVILIALAVIFVPMLFDEPAPRSERPQPVLTIEQPVDVERRDVPDPQPPASLGQIQSPSGVTPRESGEDEAAVPGDERGGVEASPEEVDAEPSEQVMAEAVAPPAAEPAREPVVDADPIAELARAADQRLAESAGRSESADAAPTPAAATGEWAVQVGSFGEPANAERLEAQLGEQGFTAFSRPRDNNLTTVYVGPYDSSEAGERAMGELKERANLQGLLVRVRE
ncbi:acetyl-CoA carboxylase subunit beta [Halomonas heilongjiangensis]|uniref:Acetyl-CoA carboxylase subunit beta n=2 Tax=Halomonas heilongjiangensis TaxID=1387883 RepID=A0A2N7TJ49_9GAMM|nr:acetyl-CoA carboxylase subunit beta [Halomonas heilongjiangensis]PXX87699.1 acetyl-CoA carboxylase subunit beta [Halomonas heilongjiangensis]